MRWRPCAGERARGRRHRGRDAERGNAVVEFVLITVILVPLVLGVVQVALVLHVRNTLTAAASEGARHAARADAGLPDGERYARGQASEAIAGRFLDKVVATSSRVDGAETVVLRISAEVPALGLFGPAVRVSVEGHAVEEPR
ncbi:TadE family protein [Nocardioides dubius]|uniref:TadE-like domain-containing protein n=1 Tax=Nocardioides dubius TaxID=317019 RepID=A0ABN1TLD6_9ACTN